MSYLSKAKEVLSHSGKLSPQQGRATLMINQGYTVRDQGQIWNAADWREYFDERAGVSEYDAGMRREKAEQQAFEACITRWLDTHPPADTNNAICPHCQKPNGAPGNSCAPVLSGNGGHVWLHHDCLEPWRARRRQEAIAALMAMGIYKQA